MRTINFYTLICCLLFQFSLKAQFEINLIGNWDYKRKEGSFEKFHKVITASNGTIIAVGQATGRDYRETDGLLVVMNETEEQPLVWKRFGGPGDDAFYSVSQNLDGTLTLVGFSAPAPKSPHYGWILQVDLEGNLLFENKTEPEPGMDVAFTDVANNQDGIMAIVGESYDNRNTNILFSLYLNQELAIKKVLGDGQYNNVTGVRPTEDGNFVVMGSTNEKNRSHANDIWFTKLDQSGEEIWGGPKYIGGSGFQEGNGLSNTIDGGFIIAGATNSGTAGLSDMWLVKLSKNGDLEWEKKFGGPAGDVGMDAIELSEGGYAILGQTWSHMPRAEHSILNLIVTDEEGQELDQSTYAIYPKKYGNGDDIAQDLVELYNGTDLLIVGNSAPEKEPFYPTTSVSAITYKIKDVPLRQKDEKEEILGENFSGTIVLGEPRFFDANNNNTLELNERGYFTIDVTNVSEKNLTNVHGQISDQTGSSDLYFWEDIKIGTLRPGQTKQMVVPVAASNNLSNGNYDLNVSLAINDNFVASATAKVISNEPEPARIVINAYNFIPESNPSPGENILLKLEVINTGGVATIPTFGDFVIPPGVKSIDSERVNIPSLKPREKKLFNFSFSYQAGFRGNSIPITFETSGQNKMAPVKKTFHLSISPSNAVANNDQDLPINNNSNVQTGGTGTEIIWASPDPSENTTRSFEVNKNEVNVKAIALSNGQLSKNNFGILINGKKSQGQKMDEAKLSTPKNTSGGRSQQSYSNNLYLEEGPNEVKIVYFAEDGKTIVGESQTLIFNYTPKDKPNLHVLAVGVEHNDLKYTVKDATDFVNMYLKLSDEKGRGFKKVNVYPLLKKEETTGFNIKKAFIDLEKIGIKDNDLVVVFISSHGKVSGRSGEYLLLPSDYDPQYEELSSVNFKEDVLKRLRNIDGNKLVFIDACHSGSAGSRSFSDEAASKVMNDLVHATSGMEIFASCGDNEFSYEDERWGNGAFTKAIIEAFNNVPVEVNGRTVQADIYDEISGERKNGSDGVVTIEELKYFIQQRVPDLVQKDKNKGQHPTNKSTELLPQNMGIYMVSN